VCKKLCFLISLVLVLGLVNNASADLVAAYTFEGNADDCSGEGHHGTVHGSASYSSDAVFGSQSISFTGGYVQASIAGYDCANPFTWMGWVKTTGNGSLFSKGPTGSWSGNAKELYVDSGNVAFNMCGHAVETMWTNVADGEWHHVAITWEDDGVDWWLRWYKDGELRKSVDWYANMMLYSDLGLDVFIGDECGSGGYPLTGLMDDVGFFDHALEAGAPDGSDPGTINHYRTFIIPEPATIALLGLGGLLLRRRR